MELPKTAMPIKNSRDHWVDIDGSIYAIDHRSGRGWLIKKVQQDIHGYKYCDIYDNKQGRNIQRRVHRIVAETFIPNPNGYNIVGHKNNIKSDNRVENLYWTTASENTQKAVDDGLLVNAKGYENSQSMPVIMFETLTNKKVEEFGSIGEASKKTGLCKNTIARQAKYKRPVKKKYYFRYADDPSATSHKIVGMFNYDTDVLEDTFINCHDAMRVSGIPFNTVNNQCLHGKPKLKYSDHYFKYLAV